MKIIGTNDEITLLMSRCQKIECSDCTLYDFCSNEAFVRLTPYKLKAIEDFIAEKHKAILITKGENNGKSIH